MIESNSEVGGSSAGITFGHRYVVDTDLWLRVIIENRYRRGAGIAKRRRSGRVVENKRKGLEVLGCIVVNEQHRHDIEELARRKIQGARNRVVIFRRDRGAVFRMKVDACC